MIIDHINDYFLVYRLKKDHKRFLGLNRSITSPTSLLARFFDLRIYSKDTPTSLLISFSCLNEVVYLSDIARLPSVLEELHIFGMCLKMTTRQPISLTQ